LAAGVPVVALDATGPRELIVDQEHGRLLKNESMPKFLSALEWIYRLHHSEREVMRAHCRLRAEEFSMDRTARQCLDLYHQAQQKLPTKSAVNRLSAPWRLLEDEWQLWQNRVHALAEAIHQDR
jgi:hypothetical protein